MKTIIFTMGWLFKTNPSKSFKIIIFVLKTYFRSFNKNKVMLLCRFINFDWLDRRAIFPETILIKHSPVKIYSTVGGYEVTNFFRKNSAETCTSAYDGVEDSLFLNSSAITSGCKMDENS